MLISYPILPLDNVNAEEDARLTDLFARYVDPGFGLYPVSFGNRWHGGIHLIPGTEPIRAIADGTVIAYRLAPETKDYPGQGQYDTSFVLLKHDTETGEHTRVVFYSLYMHLKPKGLLSNAQREQLAPFLRTAAVGEAAVRAPANTRIWRKEVLGFAGQLYNQSRVHFEIFATEADFAAFWRDRTAITAGSNGSDDVFGDMHFVIPAQRPFAERHPRAIAPHRIDLPGQDVFYELPLGQAGQNTERLHVVVNLNGGIRTATTFRLDAQGNLGAQVGDPVIQHDYEYELYRLATALYPDCPSAGFEYLRFGRVLGPDTTTRVENWQLICYSDTAMGYLNLADPAHQVSVLSDADFPVSWQKLEEGQAASPNDGLCDVPSLLSLIGQPPDTNNNGLTDNDEFASHANRPEIAEKLRFLICKHPSEWDDSDLDTRYARQRAVGQPLEQSTAWDPFKEHASNLAFWPQTGGLDRSVWHFHPLQFIRHYRRCGWLSERELIQIFPTTALRASSRDWLSERVTPSTARLRSNLVELNNATRKYLIVTAKRLAAFYGNAMQETRWFHAVIEDGAGSGRYAPWDGRGFLQLTWPDNYIKYWRFRGRSVNNALVQQLSAAAAQANAQRTSAPLRAIEPRLPANMTNWRSDVQGSNFDAADSAGSYWAWSQAASSADRTDPFIRETRNVSGRRTTYYSHTGFGRVAATVNVGQPAVSYAAIYGIQARFQAYTSSIMTLADLSQFPDASGHLQITPDDWTPRRP